MKKIINKIIGYAYAKSREAYYKNRYDFFRKKYNVDSQFLFASTDIRLYGDGEIILGANSYIGANSTIQSVDGQKVVIGNNCQISHNVRIYTGSVDPDQDFNKPKRKPNKCGNVIIGNGVWLGANVFINPGVNIGDNCVVGANSVVTRDLEAASIYGGVPCRLLRKKTF